jgi:hypothetical protein
MTERPVWEDLVDVFRLAKMDLEVQRDPGTGRIKAARSYACPLDFYHRRGWISDDQHSAGVDLGELWLSGIERGHHSQWKYEVTGGGGYKSKDIFSDATLRFLKACKAIDHPPALGVALRVCCQHKPAGPRANMVLLKDGLDDLVRHFRRRRR